MPLGQLTSALVPPVFPVLVGGRFYHSQLATATATFAVSANILYASPVLVPVLTTFVSINLEVTTLSAGNARMGIYVDNAGVPGALVAGSDVAAVSTGSTGGKSNAFSIALSPDWYWLASVYSATPTVRALSQTNALALLGFTANTDTTLHVGWSVAFTYGALSGADPFPGGGALMTTAAPRILLGV